MQFEIWRAIFRPGLGGVICSTCGPIGACIDEEEAERVKAGRMNWFHGGIGKREQKA